MSKKKEPDDPVQITEALSASILREMVNNLEETKLKLLLNIKELKEKLVQQKEDQTDIYYYLNKKCDESFEVIASLEEQILNEQADREIAEKLYENRLEDMKNAALSTETKLNTRIVELENKLEMLNTFSETKDETERNLKSLMNKLEEERTQFSVNAEVMENKFLLEREKLRKSYDVKYENIKRELEQSIDGKLTKKTKKTQILNIVMKKELDSQSKHAEKLLEINQSILEKDRELKLELELSQSLQAEMTHKLAMYQRIVRQLNEKVVSQDQLLADAELSHQEKLDKAVAEAIKLQARINQMSKRAARESSKLDELWSFLSSSYQLIKSSKHTPNSDAKHKEHESLLVELVREVAARHPKALEQLMVSHPTHFGDVNASQSLVGGGSSVGFKDQSVTSLSATGIPSWDNKSELSHHTKTHRSKNSRSVAVQTEGRVAPYPQDSAWLDASVASSGPRNLFLLGANNGNGGVSPRGNSHLLGDDRSIDLQSMPSLWGDGGGLSLSLMSNASAEEAYSIKSASYALPVPSSHATSKHKAMSRLRGAGKKQTTPSHFRDIDQILSDAAAKGRSHAIKLVLPARHAESSSAEGLARHQDNGSQSATSSLADLQISAASKGSRHKQSPVLSGNTNSLMAISGQGFVSPFSLPKL